MADKITNGRKDNMQFLVWPVHRTFARQLTNSSHFPSGTNWTLAILHLLNNADTLARGEDIEQTALEVTIAFGMIRKNSGNAELQGTEKAESVKGPRLIHTHLPPSYFKKQIEKCPNLKIIQTIRNVKDTLVSFYHYYTMEKRLGGFNGSWDDFFKLFRNKELAFGDYFDYYSEWYIYNKQRPNSLILTYEDMKKNLKTNVKKIAEFLDKNVSDEVIDIITTRTTFDNMKVDKMLKLAKENNPNTTGRSEFMRKGTVGDWKGYFNEEQNHFIEQRYKETLQPLGLQLSFD